MSSGSFWKIFRDMTGYSKTPPPYKNTPLTKRAIILLKLVQDPTLSKKSHKKYPVHSHTLQNIFHKRSISYIKTGNNKMSSFNAVSQNERQSLDIESDGVAIERTSRFACKYQYLSPSAKKVIGGSVLLLILVVIISSVIDVGGGDRKGKWPPPEVSEEDYVESALIKNRNSASFSLELEPEKSYRQISKMTTTTTMNLGKDSGDAGNFAETVHMEYENVFNVSPWQDYNGDNEVGLSIEVIFNKVSVTAKDSSGDFTYYSSLAENGDTDFDAVLQDMINVKATVGVF